ncbi:GDP dissociation inhibitor domain-containing protein [Hirsutella rhossiliensis]|uniref:Rab proteins geranylgeranyltransferase n=1 Tax=Hirsutella rhossiliensis TaxID=111463 RepID=A0A9P8MXJ8_9HYPO|nr:GDP dissociation inhibitor domain-containing protein [Hirsutella rhossiliensis]KAH0963928.1 GDP dissociation inhibitor domain-containing protein [Hirsutella rhossiliensis]
MESLSETRWDVIISGTGLQQSLLALALSRSGKNVLHVDSNSYYGGAEAALSLQEADEWAEKHQSTDADRPFAAAQVNRGTEGLSFSRAYSLALAPQLIHTRSELLSQLVSTKAFRQVEFLAVGSFYIFQPVSDSTPTSTLSRVPSTREDVFATAAISSQSKRSLMKFLKFVLAYDSEPQTELWGPKADDKLADFLESEFKLDRELRSYVIALTLSLDGKISVGAGLAAIHRHLTSMGLFGPGFAAVYPKWGGLSEVAQVGCRAAAVGGAVYMLGTGLSDVQRVPSTRDGEESELEATLSNGTVIRAEALVQSSSLPSDATTAVSRLTAVVESDLPSMFKAVVDGAPTPCVAVAAFPPGSIPGVEASEFPAYALVHSDETGECPSGQCTIYFSTISTPGSKDLLEAALSSLLAAASADGEQPKCMYQLYFEQRGGTGSFSADERIGTFASLPLDLAFPDSALSSVKEAWNMVNAGDAGDGIEESYMKFEDREGAADEDDAFNVYD